LFVNAVEANADWFRIFPAWSIARRTGHFMTVALDNGVGMTEFELRSFINRFGGSGKPIGDADENFGIGVKSSTMVGNPDGVVVVSPAENNEVVFCVLVVTENDCGLRTYEFEVEDEEGYQRTQAFDVLELFDDGISEHFEVAPEVTVADLREEWNRPTSADAFWRISPTRKELPNRASGTMVLLCGSRKSKSTWCKTGAHCEFDIDGGLTDLGTYLSRRIFSTPNHVSIRVAESSDSKRLDPDPTWLVDSSEDSGWKSRGVVPIGDLINQFAGERGVVQLEDEVKVHWLLRSDGEFDSNSQGGAYFSPRQTGIGVRWRDETFFWGDGSSRLTQFGVNLDEVRTRTMLIIEPPIYKDSAVLPGCYPDQSRSQLRWSNGGYLPWADWASEFQRQMPQPISDALDDARARSMTRRRGQSLSDQQKNRLSQMAIRMKQVFLVFHPDGRKLPVKRTAQKASSGARSTAGGQQRTGGSGGTSTSAHKGEAGTHEIVDPTDDGRKQKVAKKRQPKYPTVEWLSAEEFEAEGTWVAARYDPNGPLIQANLRCPIFQSSISEWADKYPLLDLEAIAATVQGVYEIRLIQFVVGVESIAWEKSINEDLRKHYLDAPSLTAAVSGFLLEDESIAPKLGALAGKASRKAS